MSTPAGMVQANINAPAATQAPNAATQQPAGQAPAAGANPLAQLEAQVAAAIANEPEKEYASTGGEIIPNPGSDQEHETNIGNAGAELAVRLERQQLAHQQQLQQINSQHSQQMGAMQNQLQQMQQTMQTVQSNIPTQRELTPAEKYQMTPEELAEIEPQLPAIQKLANQAAETQTSQAVQQVLDRMQQQESKFNETIEQMKAAQTLQGQMAQSQYDTVIYNTGLALGLDTTQLPNDVGFQQFLAQQESPYSDRTLHQVVKDAESRADAQATAKILRGYAEYRQEQTGNTGAPQVGLAGIPAGGGALGQQQQQPAQQDSPVVRMQNQRASINAERQRLNQEMALRNINPDVFRDQILKLNQLDTQLMTALMSAGPE